MSLRDWLREASPAIPAIAATDCPLDAPSVATIATIAGPRGMTIELNPAGEVFATVEEETEIRRLLTLLQCGPEHPDFVEAVLHACSRPDEAIPCFRASAAAEGLL